MIAVLDASAAAGLILPDEKSTQLQEFLYKLDHKSEIYIPLLWWYEIANILLMAEKKGRLSKTDIQEGMNLLLKLPLITDSSSGQYYLESLVESGRRYSLTAYDTVYLELAKRKKALLVSSDTALSRAAQKEKIRLFL